MSARQVARWALLAVLLLGCPSIFQRLRPSLAPPSGGARCRAVLALRSFRSPTVNYCAGLQYEMLRNFADAYGIDIEIGISDMDGVDVSTFSRDSLDLVVMPASSARAIGDAGELLFCAPLPDSTVWVFPAGGKSLRNSANYFLGHHLHSAAFLGQMARFSPGYSPYKRAEYGPRFQSASPYDALMKKEAARLGWDWRMLCALVWKESGFRIEALSPRGAEGLMQMMPHVARHYGDDMLDPAANLHAGTDVLLRMQKDYEEVAADREELGRITLAAYNAGTGRMRDIVSYARAHGLPCSTWDDIENKVLPHLQDPEVADDPSVRLGPFKGTETVAHVHEMESLYRAFCATAPGP